MYFRGGAWSTLELVRKFETFANLCDVTWILKIKTCFGGLIFLVGSVFLPPEKDENLPKTAWQCNNHKLGIFY